MKYSFRLATPLVLFPLLANVLQAHPRHSSNAFHALLGSPFSGLDHLIAWSIVIAATALVLFQVRRDSRRNSTTKS